MICWSQNDLLLLCLYQKGQLFQGPSTPRSTMSDNASCSWCDINRNLVCTCTVMECAELSKRKPPHANTGSWRKCLPWNWSLVPKRLGTADQNLILSSKLNGMYYQWGKNYFSTDCNAKYIVYKKLTVPVDTR